MSMSTVVPASPQPLAHSSPRLISNAVLVFFVVGLLETVFAYFAFSRADDHEYFLELANTGLAAVPDFPQDFLDFKAKAAGTVFYAVTCVGRWLGGGELIHLLWLRAITLAGFLCGFNWCLRTFAHRTAPEAKYRARNVFLVLVLLYPGQLAWTASLLRDGAGMALLMFGASCLRRDLRLVLAPVFATAAFALRPEYILIPGTILVALLGHRVLRHIKARITLFLLALLIFSIATHTIQISSSTFSQAAFGDAGMAYPEISGQFDLIGYLLVGIQGALDPIALSAPSFNAFGITECLFFLYLLWQTRALVNQTSTRVAAVAMALLFVLWTFAYFEMFVSGFSRHRLCTETMLIALVAMNKAFNQRKLRPAPSR